MESQSIALGELELRHFPDSESEQWANAVAKRAGCNTIAHSTNAIDVTELLAATVIAIKNESMLSVGGE
jgi:hypothetical protein